MKRRDILALLTVLVIVFTVAAVNMGISRRSANSTECAYNLQVIGIAAENYLFLNEKWITEIPTSAGGSAELKWSPNAAAVHFSALIKNEGNRFTLQCPADKRLRYARGVPLQNRHLSYFLSLDLPENEEGEWVVSGTRNISPHEASVLPLVSGETNFWTSKFHMHGNKGFLLFRNGAIETSTNYYLMKAAAQTNYVATP